MKVRPLTKFNKKTQQRQKKSKKNDDVISKNYNAIVIFPIYGQFWAIRIPVPDAWFIKLKCLLKVTLYHTKTENRTKKSLT